MRFTFFLGGGNEKIIDKIRGLRKKNMILLEEGRRHDLLITVYLKKCPICIFTLKLSFLSVVYAVHCSVHTSTYN